MNSPTATLEMPSASAPMPAFSRSEFHPSAPSFSTAPSPNSAPSLSSAWSLSSALKSFTRQLSETIRVCDVQGLSDNILLETMASIEGLGRYVDALRVGVAAEVAERSQSVMPRFEGLAARKGCRNATELVERVTLVSGSSAHRRIKLGQETRTNLSSAGGPSPAKFPQLAEALEAGRIGVDAASAIVHGILPSLPHGGLDGLKAAERELVAAATGASDLVPVACTADEIRNQAMVWQAYLDPDGMEPIERRAWNGRGFQVGTLSGGLVRGRFVLMPEVAAKLNRLFDAYLSPRTSTEFRTAEEQAEVDQASDPRSPGPRSPDPRSPDPRSSDQQRHDVIASMVDHYARSDQPPRIGSAAPTVLVTVRAADLDNGNGRGYIDGAQAPVSMRTVRHLVCTGGYQTITIDSDGSIHGLGSPQRCFTAAQRRAITARDGGCAIPGCSIPAAWCEIHHVDPAENGGPTETDNGVLLCWSHHRTVETSGWQIRMIRGAPHIKAPPWLNAHAPWTPSSKSPTMQLDAVEWCAD